MYNNNNSNNNNNNNILYKKKIGIQTYLPSASLAFAYCRWIFGDETWGRSSPTFALEIQEKSYLINISGSKFSSVNQAYLYQHWKGG